MCISVPVLTVNTVVGLLANLPCNITPPLPGDWYPYSNFRRSYCTLQSIVTSVFEFMYVKTVKQIFIVALTCSKVFIGMDYLHMFLDKDHTIILDIIDHLSQLCWN